MNTHSARFDHRIADGRAIVPDPGLTAEQLDVVYAGPLIGGTPGLGKSSLLALLTLHEALWGDDDAPGVGRTRAEGRDGSCPGR